MKTYPNFSKPFKRYISIGFLNCIQQLPGFDFIGPPSFGSQLSRKKEFTIRLRVDHIGFAGIDCFIEGESSRPGCNAITPQDKKNLKLLAKFHIDKTELQFDLDFLNDFICFLANDLKLNYSNNKRFKDALLSFLTGFSFAAVYTKFGKDQKRIKTLLTDIERLKKIRNRNKERFKKILDRLSKRHIDPFEGGMC